MKDPRLTLTQPFPMKSPYYKMGTSNRWFAPIVANGDDDNGGGTSEPTPPIPNPPKPRPFPDPERNQENAANTRIFALLVGINDYPAGITKLGGCIKDVDNITSYLQENYGHQEGRLHLKVLKDKEATYDNIINHFREHLGQATGNDSVWFHFSGHGSEQFTADEFFQSINPEGKDQTLVCYKDDQVGSQLHLADKELGVLIHEVATARAKEDQEPHIIISLDCCHSGSGTRDEAAVDIQTRQIDLLGSTTRAEASGNGGVRALESYLGGYYQENGHEEVPTAKHLLLSACTSIQKAGDLTTGGIFTSSLIAALNSTEKGAIHYADLFTRTRARATSYPNDQTPQFETLGGFDPYTAFLEGWSLGNPHQYEVFQEGGHWFVRCGAIHGLPMTGKDVTKIRIIDAQDGTLISNGYVKEVGAQHSMIEALDPDYLEVNRPYLAEITFLPAPAEVILLAGNESHLTALTNDWDDSKNIQWTQNPTEGQTPIAQIQANDAGDFIITRVADQSHWFTAPVAIEDQTKQVELVKEAIDKIVRWKRMIDLDNPATKIRQKFDFSISALDKGPKTTHYSEAEVVIPVNEDILFDNDKLAFKFHVTLKDNSQDLYFYLFDLATNCGITFMNDEEMVMRSSELEAGTAKDIRQKFFGWGPDPDEAYVERWFKLFVTTEELDYHQLVQAPLMSTRGEADFDFNPMQISNDWCAVTMHVVVKRP